MKDQTEAAAGRVANNCLRVGQRIDVYEVVDNLKYDEDDIFHSYSIGEHVAIGSVNRFDYAPLTPISNGLESLMFSEVQKCGYYLKVKSVNNLTNQ